MFEPRQEPMLQQQLLREVQRVAKIGSWETTEEDTLLWSDETLELFGLERERFSGKLQEFFALVHPDDLERVKRIRDFEGSEKAYFESEYRIIRPDGELRHMRQTAVVVRDATGKPQGFSGVVQDVSDQVRTEAKLRQAQKMEAIGQLSGGVAHDFNNILAAIMGAAELLQHEQTYDPELIDSIIQSARRGGELTHRLLAFARKQPLMTIDVDLTHLVADMGLMLDRMLGQDIKLVLELPKVLWPVRTDPAALKEVLLNLVVNARDAIPGAGQITISCRNVTQTVPEGGERGFVEIVVRDTGEGMDEAVRQQATDPFFTTKPVGKGSGLGLSMVDGFVKQSGGQMHIQSHPGQGTSVSILVPRTKSPTETLTASCDGLCKGNGERVLVIEDDDDLGMLLQKQLARLNFQATLATNRGSAIREMQKAGGFDVVLADVLLAAGERGPNIVNELLSYCPDMKPIFMTGFSLESDNYAHASDAQSIALRKPFDIEELAKVLKQVRQSKV